MKKSVAFITKYGWVGISTSLINSAYFWESKGYTVDIYVEKPDEVKYNLLRIKNNKINFIITSINKKSIIDDFYFRFQFLKKKKYDRAICFDYKGLIRGGISFLFTKTKLIYHSLEFYEIKRKSFSSILHKFLEILFAYKAKHIFTQDINRIDYLRKTLFQKKQKFEVIYNSPIDKKINVDKNYFRKLFNISPEKSIVLCIGSLIPEHYVLELVDSVEDWDEEFVLVLHGWYPKNDRVVEIKKRISDFIGKVYVSDKLFNEEEKFTPYLSCNIGFVGFLPLNNNLGYSAGAAGKLYDFMFCGKPIIAYSTIGIKELIGDNQCGVIFDKKENINDSLKKIKKSYDFFSKNARQSFYKYEFMSNYDRVYNKFGIRSG